MLLAEQDDAALSTLLPDGLAIVVCVPGGICHANQTSPFMI